jgi:hypothetical protein
MTSIDALAPSDDFVLLTQQVKTLNDRIQTLLIHRADTFSPALQAELAELLVQMGDIDHLLHAHRHQHLRTHMAPEVGAILRTIAVALETLGDQEVPTAASLRLLRTMRFTVRQRLRSLRQSRLAWIGSLGDRFFYSASTPVKVLVGLMIALPMYIGAPLGLVSILDNTETRLNNLGILRDTYEARVEDSPTMYRGDFQEGSLLLIICWICGSTGSIISILSRLSDYRQGDDQYDDAAIPILVGLFKPLIGGTFGAFLFALMASGLIPLEIGNSSTTRTDLKWLTFMAAAFTAGFSERLSKDVMAKAEGVLGAPEGE